ncbi:MAG: DUF368 domain-containing protein, partial [Acholeplasmatales bacterium]|nr:DUF368 domain-containing protein [Acholeplasmatales bacterium]
GASASTIAILMGIYDNIIFSISDIFKNFKKTIQYLFPIGIGIFIGAIRASILITKLLDGVSFVIYSVFLGISIGCLPSTYEERRINLHNKKGLMILIFSLLISILFSYQMIATSVINKISYLTYIMLFISGIVGAVGCIIPGISGMVLVMIMGYYPLILSAINDLMLLNDIFMNLSLLFTFGIGLLLGVILTSKVIIKLINKWPEEVNFSVFGFVLGSIFYILLKIFEENITFIIFLLIVIITIISSILIALVIKLSKKQ